MISSGVLDAPSYRAHRPVSPRRSFLWSSTKPKDDHAILWKRSGAARSFPRSRVIVFEKVSLKILVWREKPRLGQ